MAETAWYDDDAFWESFADSIFGRRRVEAASGEVDAVLALTEAKPGAAVLDLPCGIGRHALEFARRGFRVTGVDRTARYLEHARNLAESESLELELIEVDMREFVHAEAFDLAINLFSSFGFFDDDGDRRVIDCFYRSLRPGGCLVMDMTGLEILARRFTPRDWFELEDGSIRLEEREFIGPGLMHARWILISGDRRTEDEIDIHVYSGNELANLLRGAGFQSVQLFGGFDGAPYDLNASRLVAVARR